MDKTLAQCRQLKLKKFRVETIYDMQFESKYNDVIHQARNCNVEELDLNFQHQVGRFIDVTRVSGYKGLVSELDDMFEFQGMLVNGNTSWHVTYEAFGDANKRTTWQSSLVVFCFAWKVVLGPKDNGGLGVGSISALNNALMLKWLWRFKNESSSLWRNVVNGIHNSSRKPMHALGKKTLNGAWYNSIKVLHFFQKVGINLSSSYKLSIKSGSNTLFWLDDWDGIGPLADRFPQLFDLDKKKSCFISERMRSGTADWAWKRRPSGPTEIADLDSLTGLMTQLRLSDGTDSWVSLLSPDGSFAVRDFRSLIDSALTVAVDHPVVWIHIVPIKVICFIWRACLDRIPTSSALALRGVHFSSIDCPFCGNKPEETNHLLVDCSFSKEVLARIYKWCGIDVIQFSGVVDLVRFAAVWGRCPKKRKLLLAVTYGYIWSIWRARNDKIFNQLIPSVGKVVDEISTLVFKWVKNRGTFGNCNLATWFCSPFDIL
ncbi:hypothetical protein LXL04_037046 [Taraxacum kok-saghyz]